MKPLSLLSLLSVGAVLAPAQTPPPVHLEEFVVTGSPLRRAQDEVAQPSSVLAGERLLLLRQPSLGETLAHEPGISSTYFGPGASRPVIRGLGGDRIRVLQGGIGTLDASVVSPDHAVSLDPLLIDRIEIVRGPATLLYGGSAIGGVVNVIDSRIPEALPARPLSGRFETRLGSAAEERAAAGLLTGKAGPLAWRIDGFRRETADLRIPDTAETAALLADHDEDEEDPAARGLLPNSATETSGAGAGVSYIGARGHFGLSYTGFDSLYGVPAHAHGEEEDETDEEHAAHAVRIDLRQRRWDAHGEWIDPLNWLRVARVQFGVADYEHAELEGAEIGTRFTNRAHEGRIELLHHEAAGFEGALGVQLARSDFRAAGDEAFLPPSVTTNRAVFLYEELERGDVIWQLGARAERQKITPAAASGFAARSHTAAAFSGGAVWKVSADYSLALSLTRSDRAPNAQELFADGPHAGTGSYERGDESLGIERATGVDVSLRKRTGFLTGAVTVFATDFDDYLFEEPTGAEQDGLPVYQFVQRDARFRGAELEVIAHLHESAGQQFDVRLTADTVRATNRTDDQPLPRLTPNRVALAVDYRRERFSLSAEVRHAARARRLAPNETATDGSTVLNLSGSWRFRLGGADGELFARASNLTDETVRLHTSFLKDVAPLPGRDVTAGVRFTF
jgi:iron complex outermembrane receptor protein